MEHRRRVEDLLAVGNEVAPYLEVAVFLCRDRDERNAVVIPNASFMRSTS
jgi:hypothetical protein